MKLASLLAAFALAWARSAPAPSPTPSPQAAPQTPPRSGKLLVGAMIRSLRDQDENIRAKAAEDLGKVNPPPVEAVPALVKALKDRSPDVRYRAAETLERIGTPRARKAVLEFRRKMAREKTW